MRLDATPKTAALTGIWTVIGMTAFEAWKTRYSPDVVTHNIMFLVVGVFFFFGPVIVFVMGRQYFRSYSKRHVANAEYRAELKSVYRRMFWWFLAAGFIGLPLQALVKWIFAI